MDPYSRSTIESILAGAGILPKTSDLQEVDELPIMDQEIQDDKKGIAVAGNVNDTPLEEKSIESEPLVYAGKQEEKYML